MGSKWGGSQRRSVAVPPRLGVWARPRAGASVAPASVAPPSVKRSRRLRFIGSSSMLAEFLPEDLADRALRQRVDEAYLLGALVLRQPLLAKRHQVGRGR